jgi:hypothetical protein
LLGTKLRRIGEFIINSYAEQVKEANVSSLGITCEQLIKFAFSDACATI